MTRIINGRKRQIKPMLGTAEQLFITVTMVVFIAFILIGFLNN